MSRHCDMSSPSGVCSLCHRPGSSPLMLMVCGPWSTSAGAWQGGGQGSGKGSVPLTNTDFPPAMSCNACAHTYMDTTRCHTMRRRKDWQKKAPSCPREHQTRRARARVAKI